MNDPAYWVATAALLLGCYFAACASALRTYSRTRLSELLEDRNQVERLDPFIASGAKLLLMTGTLRTILNLVVLLSILWIMGFGPVRAETASATPPAGSAQLWGQYLLVFVLTGGLISIFGVAIPVSLARYQPEQLLARSMRVLQLTLILLTPLANVLYVFDPIVRRVFGGNDETSSADDRLAEEILSVVEDHEEEAAVDEDRKDMLEGVIELRSTAAGQIMTPRTDVKGIEANATLQGVKEVILDLGHSRIPVYRGNLDDIVGVLYAKDMIKYLDNGEPWSIQNVIREAYMVPESKPVNELLAEFKTRKVHIAVVLDEYGGTAGLVTIEDILEEIVGEIQDEYEPTAPNAAIQKIDDKIAEVDARVRINDLNDELDLELPEHEDYETVGGFVFSTLGHIPAVGENFEFENVRVTVAAAERTKVLRVRLEMVESIDAGNGR